MLTQSVLHVATTQSLANADQLSWTCCWYQVGQAAEQGPSCSDTAGDAAAGRLLGLAQVQEINIKNTVKQIQLGTISPSKLPFTQLLLEPSTIVPPVHLQMLLSEHQLCWERKDFFPLCFRNFFTLHKEESISKHPALEECSDSVGHW